MALVRSIVFSILASLLATMCARALSGPEPPHHGDKPARGRGRSVIVIVPVVSGNSNNRIGYVREVHHHHHPLFGRTRD